MIRSERLGAALDGAAFPAIATYKSNKQTYTHVRRWNSLVQKIRRHSATHARFADGTTKADLLCTSTGCTYSCTCACWSRQEQNVQYSVQYWQPVGCSVYRHPTSFCGLYSLQAFERVSLHSCHGTAFAEAQCLTGFNSDLWLVTDITTHRPTTATFIAHVNSSTTVSEALRQLMQRKVLSH